MIKYFKIIVPAVLLLMAGGACKKAGYLTDSGIHEAITPLSTYDYLAQHSWKFFDTTIAIIDHYNLKDEVNQAPTFFAFTDYSIATFLTARRVGKQSVDPNSDYTLDSLYKYMTADSIRQYMFNTQLRLGDLPVNETSLQTSMGNTTMGVYRELQAANQYTQRTNAPTYLLYLVKVRGALDIPGQVPPTGEEDKRELCQTTGILTSNGAKTLHVVNNLHVFVAF